MFGLTILQLCKMFFLKSELISEQLFNSLEMFQIKATNQLNSNKVFILLFYTVIKNKESLFVDLFIHFLVHCPQISQFSSSYIITAV